MRKSLIWLIVGLSLLLAVSIGATVAYLVASSNPVTNTFTVGAVDITLTETTGSAYKLIPGVTVEKDPAVTVLAGSEGSWLFVKVEKSQNFDTFCTYEMADGWTALAGHPGIYYRKAEKTGENAVFSVLKNNSISVHDSITEELLSTVTENPTLKFTAYAVQREGLDSVHDAWQALNQGEEE